MDRANLSADVSVFQLVSCPPWSRQAPQNNAARNGRSLPFLADGVSDVPKEINGTSWMSSARLPK